MRFKIRYCTMPNGEEIPLLIDEAGMPHLLANAFVLTKSRNTGRAPGSQEQTLRGIGRGLRFLDDRQIDLTTRCASGDFLSLEELVDLADACRARLLAGGIIGGSTAGTYWDACLAYIDWHADAVIGRAHGATKIALVRQRTTFENRCKNLRPRPGKALLHRDRVGLEPELRRLLLKVAEPGSPLNPFRKKLQKRNYAIILIGIELGLRAGELLSLHTRHYDAVAVPPSILIMNSPPDPNDKRRQKPRVKTLGRLLQPPEYVLQALDGWLKERRDVTLFPGARKHPYMFVETTGQPLSLRGLRSMYERLGAHIQQLRGVGSHILRHTAADLDTELSELEKWDEDVWRRHMEYKFGWSRGSDQPYVYSKGETGRAVNRKGLARQKRDLTGD